MNKKSVKILLIEDEPGHVELIMDMLDGAILVQPSTTKATTLKEARESLLSAEYDAILADLALPDSFYKDTIRKLRETARDIPLVALTSLDDQDTIFSMIKEGADDCIPKSQLSAALLERTLIYCIDRFAIERDVKQSEEKFRNYFEKAHASLVVADLAGKILEVNPSFSRFIGYGPEEIAGKSFREITHKEDQRKSVELVSRLANGSGEEFSLEKRYIAKNGGVVWGEVNVQRVEWKAREECLLAEIVDITSRKQFEMALGRTQFVVDHTSDAFFIVGADARFLSVNVAACKMHGYSREELLSMSVPDLSPDFPLSKWEKNWEEIKARRSFSFETRGRAKDGKILFVEVMQNYIEDQGKEYLYVFVRDITGRKRLEEQNRIILEKAIDGFWVANLHGRILQANAAFLDMTGYNREELLSMRIQDLEASETPEQIAEHIQKVIREGGDFFESRHRRKDGAIMDVAVSANFIDIEGGRLFSFIRDITGKKQAEAALKSEVEKLAKANAELESFNRLAVGREIKMIELKNEINGLLEELGREKKYRIHRPEGKE